jgi:uncharacterized protein YndB with AHSA1/START domain
MVMAVMAKEAQVSLPSDREVEVVRTFQAPRALVYEAYTTAALLQRWLSGQPGWSMPVCEMDVRVGGTFRWRWRSDAEGKEFGFSGVFREVTAPAKLVHTEVYDPGDIGGSMGESNEALITVSFAEHDGVTTVTTRMDFGSKAGRDAAVSTGMTDGMELSYQVLDAMLAEKS